MCYPVSALNDTTKTPDEQRRTIAVVHSAVSMGDKGQREEVGKK